MHLNALYKIDSNCSKMHLTNQCEVFYNFYIELSLDVVIIFYNVPLQLLASKLHWKLMHSMSPETPRQRLKAPWSSLSPRHLPAELATGETESSEPDWLRWIDKHQWYSMIKSWFRSARSSTKNIEIPRHRWQVLWESARWLRMHWIKLENIAGNSLAA